MLYRALAHAPRVLQVQLLSPPPPVLPPHQGVAAGTGGDLNIVGLDMGTVSIIIFSSEPE